MRKILALIVLALALGTLVPTGPAIADHCGNDILCGYYWAWTGNHPDCVWQSPRICLP